MTTIRRGTMPSDFFTIVPNSYARDESLTWASRGLLSWMLSHADGFDITEADIIEAGPSGRDGVRAMVRELEQAGYLRRRRAPIPTGGSTVEYLLTDPRGTENPSPGSDGKAVPRSDQEEQGVSAGKPTDGKAVVPSFTEDQKKIKTPSVSKATRIPDDFYPTPEMQAWFREERLHEMITNPRAEHESFCDYWRAKAGADARKLDWAATWRNWMRRAGQRGGNYGPGQPRRRPSTDDKVREGLDLVEHFRQMEETA